MKDVPSTKKNILTLILLIAITIGFTLLFFNFSQTIKDEPAKETIELKYSKKGLYLFPRFEIIVSNSERPSTVSKEQFESIETGDQISGYMKNADTFVTEKDIQFEKGLGVVLLLFLYFVVFAVISMLLKNIQSVKTNQKRKGILHTIIKVNVFGFMSIYIMVGLIFTVLMATNAFHKINTKKQTEVEATVLSGDFNTTRSHRGSTYTTYELFIQYEDKQGTSHITKKAVTGNTYNQYDAQKTIPLSFQSNNKYDTFIKTKHANEIWPAFLNLFTFFIAFYLISLFFIIKTWRKRKHQNVNANHECSEENDEEINEIHLSEFVDDPSVEDSVAPPIQEKNSRNIVAIWKDKYKNYKNQQEVKQHTEKWEKRTLWILAIMALITGAFIFPFVSVDDNGKFLMTYTLLAALIATFLCPVCFTFWRPHTKWYLPILYLVVSAVISTGSFLLLSTIIDTPVQYFRVIQFYLLITITGWIPLFIISKVIKGFIVLVWKK